MSREAGATYPLDAAGANRTEGWHYDFAGKDGPITNPADHDGAVVEQFRVNGVDQMMSFDCGGFELK